MRGDATATLEPGGFTAAPAPLLLACVLCVLLVLMLTLSACGDDSSSKSGASGEGAGERFGTEAPPAQARQAETAALAYLTANAREQWKRACSYLARSTRQGIRRLLSQAQGAAADSCASFLALTVGQLPDAERAALADADVTAVRVKGDRGRVFYADSDGNSHTLPIQRDHGRWAIAAVAATNFNPDSPTRPSA